MLNQELIQKEYGYLEDAVFLNVSSVVMPPMRVRTAYRNFMDDYIENFGSDIVPKAWGIISNTRTKLASLIHADHDHEIGFVKNTSEGISIIANGFPFKPGDNVVIADQEHQSILFPWINMHQQKGIELHIVKSVDGEIPFESIIQAIDDKTRIVAVSSAQFSTGFAVDLRAVGAECKRRGIVFVVDGIQTLGRFDVNVKECNIDYMAAGSNKGLLGTLGTGFVYCSDRIVKDITPTYAGYQSVVSHVSPPSITTDFEQLSWYPHARRFESGNQSYNCILAICKGVELILELGIENIEKHVRSLEKTLREKISDLKLHVVQAKNPENWGGIVCVYYPPEHEADVVRILGKHKIHATMRGGYMRFGLHFYNTEQQMSILSKALHEIDSL